MNLLVQDIIKMAERQMRDAGIADCKNDAEMIFCWLKRIDRSRFFMEWGEPADDLTCENYFRAVARRCQHEPLQYITGTQAFMGIDLHVEPGVLIPRLDTEVVVEKAEAMCKARRGDLILDLCSGDLVSYTIFDRPTLSMVTSMLDKAFEIIPDGTGLILHSDQGWHYQHKKYQRMLEKKGIRQSMSRKGNCLDNAVMENFFGLLKSELLYLQNFDSLEHFKAELIDYLDYYNNRRIKLKLKGLTPAQHRCQTLQVA